MSVENPVIKFSPFEALLIGEKNKIAKRKPMKNTIFVPCTMQQKKTFNLRAMFDLKEEKKNGSEDPLLKIPQNVNDSLQVKNLKCIDNNKSQKSKSKIDKKVYCYKFEGHKIVIKNNKLHKVNVKNKQAQSNKVKFKRDFKYKETLEERIVHKIQKRKKKLKRKLIENGVLTPVRESHCSEPWPNKHTLRGKNGKFIRKDDYERIESNDDILMPDTDCLNNSYHVNISQTCMNGTSITNPCGEKLEHPGTLKQVIGTPKKVKAFDINVPETMLNELSRQYYKNLYFKELHFPPLNKKLEIVDFDDDRHLMDILYESQPKALRFAGKQDFNDFSEALESAEILCPSKGLKIYERKKPTLNKNSCNNNGFREVFNNSMKENHWINNAHESLIVNKLNSSNDNNAFIKGRRNGLKYRIDERPTKDNHLISRNKFRSLFYKTACGTETYLGNFIKPVLLNSSFGRLPDIC